jgi:hypothetical protein
VEHEDCFVRGGDWGGDADRLRPVALPAQAGYVVTLTQQGSDVVATGSGPIDLTGLSFIGNGGAKIGMVPFFGEINTGEIDNIIDLYTGSTGPTNFGSGGVAHLPFGFFANSGSGDAVGIGGGEVNVPAGYLSGAPLSDTATYDNQTFSSLGVNPGVYEWTWGSGTNQNFTLDIVPEPSTWAMLLVGFGLLGLGGYRKTRDNALA